MRRTGAQRVTLSLAAAVVALTSTGCSLVDRGDDDDPDSVSVFSVGPGDCLSPPDKASEELSSLQTVPCTEPHTQEAYAVVAYSKKTDTSDYPGQSALEKFADGTCAARYGKYVGVEYPDSSLFFTYLLPSARGWQQNRDRNVVCFVTTTGQKLTASVRGSKL